MDGAAVVPAAKTTAAAACAADEDSPSSPEKSDSSSASEDDEEMRAYRAQVLAMALGAMKVRAPPRCLYPTALRAHQFAPSGTGGRQLQR
jgi:hypothetical protein